MSVAARPSDWPGTGGLFHYLIEPQTYLNIVYLLLTLPLGTAYFTVLITGFSFGFGMVITLLGIPILLGMLIVTRGMAAFERQIANHLLGTHIPPLPPVPGQGARLLPRIGALVRDTTTWKSLAYLLLAYPLGIFSFCVTVTLVALPPYLVFLPIYYRWTDLYYAPYHRVETLAEAFLFVPLGIVLIPLVLAALNGLAAGHRALAHALLGRYVDAAHPVMRPFPWRVLAIWGFALTALGLVLAIGLWPIGSIGGVQRTFAAPFSIGPWLAGAFIPFFTGVGLLIAARLRRSTLQAWGLGLAGFGLGISLTLWPIGYIVGVQPIFDAPLHLGPWMAAGFLPLFLGLALILADLPSRSTTVL